MPFNFIMDYQPGIYNGADYLSRSNPIHPDPIHPSDVTLTSIPTETIQKEQLKSYCQP